MMKKTMKQISALALAAMMGASVIGGCGTAQNQAADVSDTSATDDTAVKKDPSVPGWQQDNSEHVELTWYVNATWWDPSFGEDLVTKKIAEDTNVTINFVVGDDTNLNTYFAGEDLPDVITLFDSSSSAAVTADSWAMPLQDLADKYDPYFYEVVPQETLNWMALEDGKAYGCPGYFSAEKDYDAESYDTVYPQQAFVMRKDVYEALGEPDMSTPEKFLETLGKIKEEYPDLVPLGFNAMTTSEGSLGSFFQNLLGIPLLDENNNWYDRQMDEDYLNWISTLNKAYNQGYIIDDSFADDGDAFNEKLQVGKYACVIMGSVVNMNQSLQAFYATNPEAAYIAVDGPKSSVEGRKPIFSNAGLGGWTVSYVTKNCKNPERAIELFTYLMSDYGEIISFYGIEGETYTIQDGKYILTDEVKKIRDEDPEKYRKEYRLSNFYLFGNDRYNAMGECPKAMEQIYQFGSDKIHERGLDIIREQFSLSQINPDSNTVEARNMTNINTNWYTTIVSLIRSTNDTEFQKVLDEYKAFRETNGWDKIVQIHNEKLQNNRAVLGYN